MPPKYVHKGLITFLTDHEVELPPIDTSRWLLADPGHKAIWNAYENRYVMYELEIEASLFPETGDGWNEPKLPPTSEVCSAIVTKLKIWRPVFPDRDFVTYIEKGFIGPMEPGVVPIGSQYKALTDEELEHLGEEASMRHFEDYEAERDHYLGI